MQGFNMGRYVPPDLEGLTTANKLHSSRRRGPAPPPTVRFEMPFAVWCTTCPRPTIIGQGVRFNAEKIRAGAYFSTPIWSFKFRHAECKGEIEVRTDPKNTAYVVVSGARKRETGEDEPREGDTVVMSEEERERLRQNAFAGLEKTIEDRERVAGAGRRVAELEDASWRHWDDPYSRNQALRKTFRAERKRLEREGAAAEDLKDRMSLGIDLLPPTETDALRASLVDFGASDDVGVPSKALAKPLFPTPSASKRGSGRSSSRTPRDAKAKGKLKSEILASKRKETLVSHIIGNTRIAQDPFLEGARPSEGPRPAARFSGVKRKQNPVEDTPPPEKHAATASTLKSGLVHYDSE